MAVKSANLWSASCSVAGNCSAFASRDCNVGPPAKTRASFMRSVDSLCLRNCRKFTITAKIVGAIDADILWHQFDALDRE